MAANDGRWFRLEVVLAALKLESLMVAGFLERLGVSIEEAAALAGRLRSPSPFWCESMLTLMRDCRSEILRQRPALATIPDPDLQEFAAWLSAAKGEFGHLIDFDPRP